MSTLEDHYDRVNSVTWSKDATQLASASDNWTVKIWDPTTAQCVSMLKGHRHRVKSVAWSHDGTRLASASDDRTVKIWDPAAGQCVMTLEGHSHFVSSVIWSHDATRLASVSSYWPAKSYKRKIWDSATGQCVSTLEGHSSGVNYSSPTTVGYGLSSNGTWITLQGENLLWLPSEYRPSSLAISGPAVSIGCSSGRVLIFTFSGSNSIS